MKKCFLSMLMALALSSPSFAAGDVGNGGGGVVRNGKFLTFKSAALSIVPLSQNKIEGLPQLIETVRKMPMYGTGKGKLLQALIPAGERKYFKVPQISPKDYERLVETYQQILHIEASPADIRIFAVTKGKETFLLPDFEKLSFIEKQSILAHEAAWVIDPRAKYQSVVNFEMAFQTYLEEGKTGFDPGLYFEMGKLIKDYAFILRSAALDDYENGRLKPFLNKYGGIPSTVLFSKSFRPSHQGSRCFSKFISKEEIKSHLHDMAYKYPSVHLFPTLFMLVDYLNIGSPTPPYLYENKKFCKITEGFNLWRSFVENSSEFDSQGLRFFIYF